ncbi:MAG: hypothetical protein DRI32_04435 [Chloroflexi bacterium]|nr:MAG: hypothetical protein DRI32_04435 [Chloroflexota bacterium]
MKKAKSLSWWIVVLGAWEIVAPFIFGYSAEKTALWDAIILGVALVILGIWAALVKDESTLKTLSWVNAALGVWLIIAPFLLSYSGTTSALWNDIVVGLVILALGATAASALPKEITA